MKSAFSILFVLFFIFNSGYSQHLVSATYKGVKTKAQITTQFSLPFIKYGAKYYKVAYTSTDAKGQPDTLTGLMMVPDDPKFEYPRLVYQHGTSDCKKCVPSYYGSTGGEEGQLGLLFAGLGFVTFLPDYVGMGDGRGFQTYVHNGTIVSASQDMLSACAEWTAQNNVYTNDQLFITGYSQGGYASMALHKALEESSIPSSVTAAAHLSGPYSLSGVMRDLILIDSAYNYPAYIPNTVLGFNEVYGNLYTDLNDFFKPEYTPDIKKYYDGTISLSTLNSKLIQLLKTNTGASVAGRMIRDDVKNEIISNPIHPANQLLLENDLFNWAPKIPTRIFYCKADDQVPYKNSVVTRDAMLAKGATNLVVTDVNPTANHSGCVNPALTQTVLFFLGLQKLTSSVSDLNHSKGVRIFPNPVRDILNITFSSPYQSIVIFDMQGNEVLRKNIQPSDTYSLDISSFNPGLFIGSLHGGNGEVENFRFVKVK